MGVLYAGGDIGEEIEDIYGNRLKGQLSKCGRKYHIRNFDRKG